MFTGRPRRAVNLGSKKQASAHDVLRNAELQRQKREKQRKETIAVQVVQSLWRASQMLMKARNEYALMYINDSSAKFSNAEQFAWILPAIPSLPQSQQVELTERFVESPCIGQFNRLLLDRLPILLTIHSNKLHALAVRVLQSQNPSSISVDLLVLLLKKINLASSPSCAELVCWLAEKDPYNFLYALLKLNSAPIVSTLPIEAIRPLFKVSRIPALSPGSENTITELLRRLLAHSTAAWRLIFALVMQVDALHVRHFIHFTPELCSREVVCKSLDDSPLLLSKYIIALFHLFPKYKPNILLQLALVSTPSPIESFWRAFKMAENPEDCEILLHITTELYSYWLLVATDAELASNTSLCLRSQDLLEFATTIRNKSFEVLWNHLPNRRVVVSGAVGSILKVLRQLYTRDSRMHLFPPRFWLMDTIPQGQFLQNIENSDSLYGMGRGVENDDDDEEDDDLFEEEETLEEPDSTDAERDKAPIYAGSEDRLKDTKLILKASPSLRILEFAPFFVPFETRVALFYKYINKDRESQPMAPYNRHHFDIYRETLSEDAQLVFASLGPRVKTDLQVRLFSNGMPEAGVDGGGLTRELLMSICDREFHQQLNTGSEEPDPGTTYVNPPAFIETLNHTFAPNPVFGENPSLMSSAVKARYFFLGQVIGKCLYENLLVNVEFAPFFLSKWNKFSSSGFSVKSSFDDLSLLDNELYTNISKLHNIHGEEVAALGLDFTVVDSQHRVVDLRPNGSQIPVTDSNKLEYMRELANYKLNVSLKPQTTWFVMGLSQVIHLGWLNMFNPDELNTLISGESQDFDVEDLKLHSEVFGFHENSHTIQNLWEVLREFQPQQRADFLQFITSVPRAPLLGFSRLEPRLGIRFAGNDDNRLPTSSTCVNLLKLPEYSSKNVLRKKLLYSIESKAGFELS